ncbi:MAG: aminodeoxychorismate/anthranilate synthase component II [Lachnospiraceae bacterium]|nr:aminodeoxychorismate/anthranilate synthase component II [Lachnospiraceae bacterium]
MILLIDNYDSFSYNLYQYLGEFEENVKVIRNDELSVEEIEALHPDGIVLSPGPGRPADAGVIEEVARTLGSKIPILGICLGHQGICEAFGGKVTYASRLMHGKTSVVTKTAKCPIFDGCPDSFEVARYHSLAADEKCLPECLEVTALTEDGEIMAVQHKEYPVYGLQFHPESILTPEGKRMIQNYIKMCKKEA